MRSNDEVLYQQRRNGHSKAREGRLLTSQDSPAVPRVGSPETLGWKEKEELAKHSLRHAQEGSGGYGLQRGRSVPQGQKGGVIP